ncbi:MAG: class I SAM-dependent methyltransferase [Desulfomonile sp.]
MVLNSDSDITFDDCYKLRTECSEELVIERNTDGGMKAMSMIPDPRSLLSLPAIYTLFQRVVRGRGEFVYVQRHVRPRPGDRILDLGCGTGDILRHMPAVEYLGIDSDERLIESARKIYGERGAFSCLDLSKQNIPESGNFDLVVATGVLHHLTDDQALRLFKLAHTVLKPGERLVTMDGCYAEGQSFLARLILSKDRGKHVRTKSHCIELASQVFTKVEATIYHDIMRIPSSMIILECSD